MSAQIVCAAEFQLLLLSPGQPQSFGPPSDLLSPSAAPVPEADGSVSVELEAPRPSERQHQVIQKGSRDPEDTLYLREIVHLAGSAVSTGVVTSCVKSACKRPGRW